MDFLGSPIQGGFLKFLAEKQPVEGMGSVPTGSPFFPTVSYSFQSRCLQRSSGRWAAVLSHWDYGEGQMEYGNLRGCLSTVLLLFKKFGPTGCL